MAAQNIIILTNIAPSYRGALWKVLLKDNDFHFYFWFGKAVSSGIKEIDFSDGSFKKNLDRFKLVKNLFFKEKILFWQRGVIRLCLTNSFNIIILPGDAYILSSWVAAIICRIRGVKVIFWGHGFYGNESKPKKTIRKLFFLLANKHLLYERRGKKNMIISGFKPDKLHVVFNSLDYESHKKMKSKFLNLNKVDVFPFFNNNELPVIIFVGRLTAIKKLDMLVKAVHIINKKENRVNALIVGDGVKKNDLEKSAKKEIRKGNIHFYGECYSDEIVGSLLTCSDLCLSPGNVGLTAIHSLSFGTPVCTHGNFKNQMPEVEAIKNGETGFFFQENNLNSLVEVIESWLTSTNNQREIMHNNCFEIINKYYNPKYQLKVIKNMLNGNQPFL